jgi:hypothetical protein
MITLADTKVGDTVYIEWEGEGGEATVLGVGLHRESYLQHDWTDVLLGWKRGQKPVAMTEGTGATSLGEFKGWMFDPDTIARSRDYTTFMMWGGITECTILPAKNTDATTSDEGSILGTLALGLLALGGAALTNVGRNTQARVISDAVEPTVEPITEEAKETL